MSGSILVIIFIILLIGISLILYLNKKGRKADARVIKFLTGIIIIILICVLFFNLYLSYKESENYMLEMSLVEIKNDSNENIILNIKFDEKELTQGSGIEKEKIYLKNLKESNRYYFEIQSENFKFINSNYSISGNISINNFNLKLEDINSNPDYYQIITNNNDKIQIETIGFEGNITFMFRIYPETIS